MDGLEGDIAACYDQEAEWRTAHDLHPQRVAWRDEFLIWLT